MWPGRTAVSLVAMSSVGTGRLVSVVDDGGKGGYYGGLAGTVVGGLAWAVVSAFVIGRPLWALLPASAMAVLLFAGVRLRTGHRSRDLRVLAVLMGLVVVIAVVVVNWWWPLFPARYTRGIGPIPVTLLLVLFGGVTAARLILHRIDEGAAAGERS